MPFETACAVIERELGRPVDEVFDWVGERPMAAASIGQVHSAHLHGGREVVVKVQYPGVGDAIRSDLQNTELIASFMKLGASMSPIRFSSDPRAFAEEMSERITEELDYRIEAANQTALDQPQERKDRWGEVINRFVYGSLYELGAFNADPHPGNYLFHDDGGVTFLDFGCVKRYRPDQIEVLYCIARALIDDDDPEALFQAYVDIKLIDPKGKLTAQRFFDFWAPIWEPVRGEQPYTYTPSSRRRRSSATSIHSGSGATCSAA